MALEGEAFRLSYMVRQGKLFTWPAGEEQLYLHPIADIIRQLPSPEPVLVGSRLFSRFVTELLEE